MMSTTPPHETPRRPPRTYGSNGALHRDELTLLHLSRVQEAGRIFIRRETRRAFAHARGVASLLTRMYGATVDESVCMKSHSAPAGSLSCLGCI